MGYYTSFSLYILEGERPSEDYIEELREICQCAEYAIDESGCFYSESKWYTHEDDLKKFSSGDNCKDVLFQLEGEGEDNEDLWIKYFKNGKMQICRGEVFYPEYDESKLE